MKIEISEETINLVFKSLIDKLKEADKFVAIKIRKSNPLRAILDQKQSTMKQVLRIMQIH